jgi:hypothetical protein
MTDYEQGVNQASAIYKEVIRDYVAENAKLKRRLEILKAHGIEIVDTVAGGFEIYNKEHARADRLQDENAKLRKFAKNAYRHICTQEGYLRGSGYDSFDYCDTVARELEVVMDA